MNPDADPDDSDDDGALLVVFDLTDSALEDARIAHVLVCTPVGREHSCCV
jgi:hypothetical protein